jgi:hypothetical protein
MDVKYQDKKLHNDGILDGLAGYKEWFHFAGSFTVKGKPLTFMVGFPKSLPGMGALGWVSFDGAQYSLAGNKDKGKDAYFDVTTYAQFNSTPTGYTLDYPVLPSDTKSGYTGTVTGNYPDYTIKCTTPDIDITIKMSILSKKSVVQRELFGWMPDQKRIASWFHSGDITATLDGTIHKETVTGQGKGWYERMWSKVVVLWPSEWLFFMAHLDNGGVFDVLSEKTLGKQIYFLDECWLYQKDLVTFSDYWIKFPEKSNGYDDIINKHIICGGSNKAGDSFELTATIADFRQYESFRYYANMKWSNYVCTTKGKAEINGEPVDLTGRGYAEKAPIKYWWL